MDACVYPFVDSRMHPFMVTHTRPFMDTCRLPFVDAGMLVCTCWRSQSPSPPEHARAALQPPYMDACTSAHGGFIIHEQTYSAGAKRISAKDPLPCIPRWLLNVGWDILQVDIQTSVRMSYLYGTFYVGRDILQIDLPLLCHPLEPKFDQFLLLLLCARASRQQSIYGHIPLSSCAREQPSQSE